MTYLFGAVWARLRVALLRAAFGVLAPGAVALDVLHDTYDVLPPALRRLSRDAWHWCVATVLVALYAWWLGSLCVCAIVTLGITELPGVPRSEWSFVVGGPFWRQLLDMLRGCCMLLLMTGCLLLRAGLAVVATSLAMPWRALVFWGLVAYGILS